ncbi:MAG: CocE/NonD family hydrolase [Bryobacteraceae bacterium]
MRSVWAGLALAAACAAQPKYDVQKNYRKSQHMVAMRDGVRLHTTVYSPRRGESKFPILMLRTPYGTGPYEPAEYRKNLGPSPHSFEFEEEGFIFVYQDVRGKFRSEGDFVVMRPHRAGKRGTETDESSDTYDTIEWLLNNVPQHNGRVGQIGTSYPGFQTVHGMIEAHPALAASSPQASPADMFLGDDFHHNGAFRLAYTFGWLARNASGKEATPFDAGTPDGYRFFLEMGPLANANAKYLKGRSAEWNRYMEHPDYDEFWRVQNPLPHLKNITHPVLNVAAWFDAEDFYGPLEIYAQIEKTTPANRSVLVVGPWSHGGWNSHVDGGQLGAIAFAGKPAAYFREKVQFPFFRHHLKGKGELKLPEVLAYETGSGEWRSYDKWPPVEKTAEKKLYMRMGRKLSFDPPPEEEGFDAYVSDPARPVPSSGTAVFMPGHVWMVEDQRFSATRPDVLTYETEPLAEPVTVTGKLIARLYASTSGTDSDYVVKLIDVYPGDAPDRMGHYQMLLSGEVMRAKYRRSFERPEPMRPGVAELVEVDLRDKNHRFGKGHRIMVHVQSTWFPVIDRNPQVFQNIYQAQERDFQKAEQKIFRSRNQASHVVISVKEN